MTVAKRPRKPAASKAARSKAARSRADVETEAKVPADKVVKTIEGRIVYFDPSTGRGTIEGRGRPEKITLDVGQAKILNPGYVHLKAGRAVKVSVEDDTATELLAE